MDPKVCGKLLRTHGEGNEDDDEELRDGPPSGGAPKQAPRWDLTGTEGYGGGIRVFSLLSKVSGYVDLYRRKEDTGGCSRVPRGRGRVLGRGTRPHPCGHPEAPLMWFISPPCVIFSKNISREGFIPFGLRLIFFFCKTLKQAKNNNLDWAFGLVG